MCCHVSPSSSQLENLWFKENAVSHGLLIIDFLLHTWTSNFECSQSFQFNALS